MKESPSETEFKSAFTDFLIKLDYSDIAVIQDALSTQWHKLYNVSEKSIVSKTMWALRSCCDYAVHKKQKQDVVAYHAEPAAQVAQA